MQQSLHLKRHIEPKPPLRIPLPLQRAQSREFPRPVERLGAFVAVRIAHVDARLGEAACGGEGGARGLGEGGDGLFEGGVDGGVAEVEKPGGPRGRFLLVELFLLGGFFGMGEERGGGSLGLYVCVPLYG